MKFQDFKIPLVFFFYGKLKKQKFATTCWLSKEYYNTSIIENVICFLCVYKLTVISNHYFFVGISVFLVYTGKFFNISIFTQHS